MSYINDALKKAQEEKSGRNEYYGGIISRPPEKNRSWGRRWLMAGVFGCIVLVAGGWAAFNWERWIGEKPGPIATKPARTIIVDQAPPAIGEISGPGATVAMTGTPPAPAVPAPMAVGAAGPQLSAPPAAPAKPLTPFGNDAKKLLASPGQGSGALKPLPVSGPAPGAEKKPSTTPAVEAKKTPATPQVVKTAGTAVQSLYRQALALQKKKDLAGAADLYRQVVKLDPKHAYAWNNLGVIQMRQKENRQAIASFQRAAALKGRYADPYYNMACAYAQTDDKEQSLRYLKKAAALNGEVMTWAKEDTDLTNIVRMPEFNQFMEEQGK